MDVILFIALWFKNASTDLIVYSRAVLNITTR